MSNLKIFYYSGAEEFHPEQIVEQAVLAEKAGFDGLAVSEHFHPWVDDKSTSGFTFSTLGAVAAKTDRVELVTTVTTPLFRFHPAIVAQAAATIDRLSGGRFNLGVGTGENINEGPLGYNFPKYPERRARMSEALQIMRRLLDGEKLNFDGEYYKTQTAKLYSPPISKVPIWLAAGGPKSAALAKELAHGVIVSVKNPNDTIEKVIQPAGEEAKVMASRWAIRAANEEEAWDVLQPWRGLRAPNRLGEIDPKVLQDSADSLPREEIMSKFQIVNTAQDYLEIYAPLVTQIRADVITIQTTSKDQHKTIEMLGREVLPELRKLR